MSTDPSCLSDTWPTTGAERLSPAPRGPLRVPPRRLLPALLILALLPGVSRAAVVEEIVAKVNNRIITKSEFEERSEAVQRQIYQKYYGKDLDEELQAAQDSLLANLITENLLLERAETIFDMDKIRGSLIDDFRKQQKIETNQELERLLEEESLTRSELEEQLIRLALPQEIINYDVKRKISVSDREILAYYEKHEDEWATPPTVTFREIVIFYEPRRRADAEKRAKQSRRDALDGIPFEELVDRYSEAGTRESGGLLGPLPEADLHPQIASAALALGPGEVSRPVDTGRSFHVIRLEGKTGRIVRPIEDVRDQIYESVREDKFRPRYERFLRKLWKGSQIDISPKYDHLLVFNPLDLRPAETGAEEGGGGPVETQ